MKKYGEEYHSIVHQNLIKNKGYYLFRAKYANDIYWKHLKGKVLEFGSGLGQNILLHKETSLGIDIEDFSINFCKNKGIKVVKDIKKIKSNSFDSILVSHCLEHLENPAQFLKEFYRVLKPSGRLLLLLPTWSKNKPVKNFESNVSQHLYSWNFYEINELLKLEGFKIKINKFNYAYGFSVFYKLNFNLALFLIKLFGRLNNRKEMLLLAEK